MACNDGVHTAMQVVVIKDVTHCGFLAMLQFIYTNDFDESVSPLHMVELIRSLCLFFVFKATTTIVGEAFIFYL